MKQNSEHHYGEAPAVLAVHEDVFCNEYLFYQYLPIKLTSQHYCVREERLSCFDKLIGAACCDYIGLRGLDDYVNSYVYLTAKHMIQVPGCSFNRPGWHTDGFLTEDINYIWCDICPPVFNLSSFKLTADDTISMREMEEQADPNNSTIYPSKFFLRLNQYVIHKVSSIPGVIERTFAKLSFSKDKYDLIGNSHNHQLEYDWYMRPRTLARNVPQKLS